MFSLAAPVPINLTGVSVNSSMRLTKAFALSGNSSKLLHLLISPKFPGNSSYTGLLLFKKSMFVLKYSVFLPLYS
jgi:hypothetical protein